MRRFPARNVIRVALFGLLLFAGFPSVAERVRSGLLVFYDFASDNGNVVRDRAGIGRPVDLKIDNPGAARWMNGSLQITAANRLYADQLPVRLVETIRRSGELTLEAWVTPLLPDQKGPARIVTLSADSSQRNFTLGQEGDRYDVRLRTTQTGVNGTPSFTLDQGSAGTNLTHVVYARDRSGKTRVYLNGKLAGERMIKGALTGWKHFRFALANELSNDRPWLGTYHLVAVYSRGLSPAEVRRNFEAGPDAAAPASLAKFETSPGEKLFHEEIAPLFAKHCLECHDSAMRKGKLDLSRKDAAFAGSGNGEVIKPGAAAKSVLWESVNTDEMPKDREPLSQREKDLLKQWIESGAEWPLAVIDPVIYEHSGGAAGTWVQRLTLPEYIETVRAAVGVDITKEARELLPADLRADGFSNTAYNLGVDLEHVRAYAQLAEIIVNRMDVPGFARRFSKNLKFADDDVDRLISGMGKWLLRGPLEDHELITYRGIFTTVAASGGEVNEAVATTIESMLQAPRFIYRVENQQGDGSPWPVGEYELASRLSYIIWGAPPDEELLKAAEAGSLFDQDLLRKQVARMLEDPRARTRSLQFISEWLNLGHLSHLRPDRRRFPDWDPKLAGDMRAETLAFFEEVVWTQRRPLSDLLNAPVTFLTPRLAKHYGLEPKGDGLTRYDLTDVPSRGGLLTQGSILTVGGSEASMVTRGLFVLHDLLRGTVKDPPPGLDVSPVPASRGKSNRAVSMERINNKSCGGCHGKFEPLAFGLEKYDGLGTFREKDEHGNALREDGSVLIPGASEAVAYRSSAELRDLLAASDRVKLTLTWKLTQFALGRPLTARDAPVLELIHKHAQDGGGTYESLITAIVMSDLVQLTRTEEANLAAR